MSGETGEGNAAQAAFSQYKARLGTLSQQAAMPWAAMPGWTLPPSVQAPQPWAAPPPPASSIVDKLGETVRRSIDLLNAALAGGAAALAAGTRHEKGEACGCGCAGGHEPSCSCPSCCDIVGPRCCSPAVNGCC